MLARYSYRENAQIIAPLWRAGRATPYDDFVLYLKAN